MPEETRYPAYINYSKFLFAMVFLVILAGGVVRMTQSGMGCPDWPKCFGMWIPPTSADQLPPDFEKYLDKQDIDHSFNVYHTWIEYINRLLGALLGVFVFIYLLLSIKFLKIKRSVFFIALGLFFLTGFQGWLGKLVVDSNLGIYKITIHMFVALIIAVFPLINIHLVRNEVRIINNKLKIAVIIAILLLFVQILFGTFVRGDIDIISKSLAYEQREKWIAGMDSSFLIHRSFSWVILLLNVYLFYTSRQIEEIRSRGNFVLCFTFGSILFGVIMAYFNMPAFAQPLHLIMAALLFMSLIWFKLKLE